MKNAKKKKTDLKNNYDEKTTIEMHEEEVDRRKHK